MGRAASARRGVSPVGRLAVGSALALAVSLGAPTAVAADPPEVPVGPAPIVGSFQVTPDAGPVGSTVTIHGFCGFPAQSIGAGLSTDPHPSLPVHIFFGGFIFDFPLKTTSFGTFSVPVTIPAVGSFSNDPITPRGYFVIVGCADVDGNITVLPDQLFEVTAGNSRGGGPGR